MKILNIILYLSLLAKSALCSIHNASADSNRTAQSSHNRMIYSSKAESTDFSFATMVIWSELNKYINLKGDIATDQRMHYCTGNIIASKWVLTAAQCFQPLINQHTPYTSKGTTMKMVPYGGTVHVQEEWIIIKQIYIHPQYRNPSPFDTDIALLELANNFRFQHPEYKISVAVFAEHFPPDQDSLRKCWVIGYGKANIASKHDYVRYLRGYPSTAGGNMYCERLRNKLDNSNASYAPFYSCALGMGNEVIDQGVKKIQRPMTCLGDVGGGLICGGRLTGIMSQRWESELCGGENAFSSFVSVSHPDVLNWIKKYVSPLPVVMPNEADSVVDDTDLRSARSGALLTCASFKSVASVLLTMTVMVVKSFLKT